MIGLNTDQSDAHRITAEILQVLRNSGGESMSPYIVSRKIGQNLASTRLNLAELAQTGVIRQTSTKAATSYYMPTVEQLAREARALENTWKPLRPRLEHRAKIAEVRALRDAIPSLV